MPWEKVDCILLLNYKNYWKNPLINRYLKTHEGFTPSEEFEGMLLLYKNKKPIWISHPFNYAQAKKSFTNAEVVKYGDREEMKKIISENTSQKIGFDSRFTSVSSLERLKKLLEEKEFVDVSLDLEYDREIKSAEEIKRLELAAKETKKVITSLRKMLKVGVTEKFICTRAKQMLEEKDFELAFCIIAFGENTSHIHHVSSDKKLENEMPVLIDLGAKWQGYVADFTESFWFGKKIPLDYSKTMEKVSSALSAIEKKLCDGVSAQELWKETKILGKFPHALAHGIGLEEHDYPSGLGEKCVWKLRENMVLAVEPAIYTTKFGIRLENDYLITKKGFRKI